MNNQKTTELDFFLDCKTKEEARKLFLKLCLQLHPDKGGDHNRFVRMQNEYEYVTDILPNEGERKTSNYTELSLSSMIEKLCSLRGVDIELCGEWLWLYGDTYSQKEILKAFGMKFSGNKKAWYWFSGIGEEDGKKYRGRKTLNQIRMMYGSEKYESISAETQLRTA